MFSIKISVYTGGSSRPIFLGAVPVTEESPAGGDVTASLPDAPGPAGGMVGFCGVGLSVLTSSDSAISLSFAMTFSVKRPARNATAAKE